VTWTQAAQQFAGNQTNQSHPCLDHRDTVSGIPRIADAVAVMTVEMSAAVGVDSVAEAAGDEDHVGPR